MFQISVAASVCLAALVGVGMLPLSGQETKGAPPGVWMCRGNAWALGAEPEAWPFVRQHCDVITLYVDQVNKATIEDLRAFAKVTNAAGIDVAVECAGLCDWRARFKDRSAELSFTDEFRKVKRLIEPVESGGAGGKIKYLQMDGPFRRMLYQKVDKRMARTEHHTLESIAEQLVEAMKLWKKAIPDLEFYLLTNFPNWGYAAYPGYHGWPHTGQGKMGWGDYKPVVTKAIQATRESGIPLKGITVDNPYDYAIGESRSNQPQVTKGVDWIQRILDLEAFVEGQGLEFNLIFNSGRAGARKTGSDELYSGETLAFVDLYRSRGGSPRNYIVQSWYAYPSAYVPESRPGTMTHLVKAVIRKVKSAAQSPGTTP